MQMTEVVTLDSEKVEFHLPKRNFTDYGPHDKSACLVFSVERGSDILATT